MELANFDLKSSLLSPGHLESYQQNKKIVRTYEEIMESEVNRANPILKGHTNEVIGASLTNDNSFVISAGKDNTVRVWSLIDRVQEQKYDVKVDAGDSLTAMALSHDDKFMVFVVSEKYVIVWSLDTKLEMARVPAKEGVTISHLSISSDNLMFAIADSERFVKVYDLRGNMTKSHQTEESSITCLAFAQKIVFIGDYSNKINAWNLQTSVVEFSLEHESSAPVSAFLYENNRCLAVGYSNNDLVVWDVLEKLKVFNLKIDHGTVNGISYSSSIDNKTLVCMTDQRKVVFVDLVAKNVKRYFTRHTDTIKSVTQTKDGKLVITASADKLIKIWQQGEFRDYKASSRFGTSIKASTLYKPSDLFAIAYNDQSVKLFNLAEDKEKYCLSWKGQSVYAAIWSHDKKQLITANSTPEILVFSYEGKSIEFSIPTEVSITNLVLSPDSKHLYGCSGGSKIYVWNFQDKNLDHVIESETSHYVLAFNQEWTKMYSGGDSIINVWDLASKTVEHKLEGNTSSVRCLVLLANQKTLISGGNDGKVAFWNLEENKLDVSIEEESAWARSMELFNDEKFLVVVHDTSKITVVNVEEKKIEYDFSGPGSQYSCRMLNETTLIMGDSDSIRFMNLPEKKEEFAIKAHSGSIYSILLDKEHDTLVSFSTDRTIKSFKISDRSPQESYQTYCGSIKTLSLSSDYLAIATEEGLVLVYSTSSTREIKSIPVHNGTIQSIEYYNGNFASGSNDRRVALFDTNEYKPHYFEGHSDWVRSVKFSNDGRLIFSASDDKKIKAWNVEKKTQEFELEGHDGYVYTLYVFSDGKHIASGSGDKSVKLWNIELRKEEASFENHSATVLCLTASDDEKLLFSGSEDTNIAVISVEMKNLVCMMNGHSGSILGVKIYNNTLYSTDSTEVKNWLINEKKEIFSFRWRSDYAMHLCLSPDQNYLAASFNEGAIRIYDFKQNKFLETIQPFPNSTTPRIDFTADSKSLLVAIPDFNIIVWDIELKKSQEIPASKSSARNIRFSPDHSLFASYSNENKVCVWDWNEKKLLYSLEGHTSDVQVILFSNDNKFLFTGGEDNQVIKWNLETKENFMFKDHGSTVKGLAFAQSKNILVSGGHDRKVCFYNTEKNELIKSQEKHEDWVRTMAMTKDEKYVISAGDDKVLFVWNIDTQEEAFKMAGHTAYIYGIAISNDNNHIYSGAGDKTMWVWSLNDQKRQKCLRSVCGSIYCIALNKEGTIAYTGSDENTVNVFDLVNKTEVTCLFGHTRTIGDLALSEDETVLVSGSYDYTIRVFDTKTFEELALFKDGHTDYVRSVAITRNKKFVISGSDDRQIIFWNLEKKEKEFTLEGHRNYVFSVRLTLDEKYLISASRDETIKLWDYTSRTEVYSFTGHTASVKCLALMNNCKTFISGGEDSMIKAWSITDKREDYTLKGHTSSVNSLKLTSDNLRLISGSDDYKVNIWDLEQRTIELSLGGYSSGVLAVNITDEGSLLLTSGNDKILKLWKMSEPSFAKDQTVSLKPFIQVHTPDNKFELNYLYGRLNEVLKVNSSSRKLELGITDIYDPYYQNLIHFYNLIDNLRGGQYDSLLADMSGVIFSRFSYTTLHLLANTGNYKKVVELLGADTQIKTDYFGKSPLYYALAKQNQDCVDSILDFLISQSESKDKSKIQSSFGAISNDLPMIIRNSSKRLHLLLKSCLIPTAPTFAKVNQDLPIYMFNTNFLPIANDFITGNTKNNELSPVIMKYTPFTLPSKMGSEDCIEFLESIIECSNTSIYNTHLVQYVLQIQWDNLQMWVLGYTFLLWLNLILLVVLFTTTTIDESWVLPVFLLANFLLIFWESIQMFMGGLIEYFKDPWNLIDFFRFTLSMIWVVWNVSALEKNLEYRILAWLVALLNFTRGLTGFRVFDGTRYYVRLILRALGDMGYFFIMLGYSTITFGVMFQVSRHDKSFDFKTLWMDSYSLNFGNFEAQDEYNFSFETVAYMLATIVNVILMLNLLISILGDSYSNFQNDKVFIDFSEKASVILEIQKMFFWVGNVTENKYFHVLCSSTAADEDETMDERITGIENSLENLHEEVRSHSEANSGLFSDKLVLLDNKMHDKIGQVEGKITGLETKFNEMNETMKQILDFVKPKVEEKKEEEVKAE